MTPHPRSATAGVIAEPWEPTATRQGLCARLALSRVGVSIGVLAFSGVIHCIVLVCWILNDYDEHIKWIRAGFRARE
jgi:hypothetical protein